VELLLHQSRLFTLKNVQYEHIQTQEPNSIQNTHSLT